MSIVSVITIFPLRTTTKAFSNTAGPPVLEDRAPHWKQLQDRVLATETGARLKWESEQRACGRGPPHTDATLRLFDATDESSVRVRLYRDDSAWVSTKAESARVEYGPRTLSHFSFLQVSLLSKSLDILRGKAYSLSRNNDSIECLW